MDSNNDLSEELMRRLSSGGGLGECRNWTFCGQRPRFTTHLWNANVPKKKHMHSVSRKSDKSHFMNITEEVIASEIFEETNIYEDGNDVEEEPDDIIIVHMDIREPLSTLK